MMIHVDCHNEWHVIIQISQFSKKWWCGQCRTSVKQRKCRHISTGRRWGRRETQCCGDWWLGPQQSDETDCCMVAHAAAIRSHANCIMPASFLLSYLIHMHCMAVKNIYHTIYVHACIWKSTWFYKVDFPTIQFHEADHFNETFIQSPYSWYFWTISLPKVIKANTMKLHCLY